MGEYADDAWDAMDSRSWHDATPGYGRGRLFDDTPLETRLARMRAHNAFDPLWQSGEMTRTEAYAWLAKQLGYHPDDCHMARMDEDECDEVIRVCHLRKFPKLDDEV